MSYLNKMNLDDVAYLMEHKEGLKCWQTDYKLLRELRAQEWMAETEDYKRDIEKHNDRKKSVEQIPLFPDNK